MNEYGMQFAGYLPSSYGPAALNSLLEESSTAKVGELKSNGMPQGPHMPTIHPKSEKRVSQLFTSHSDKLFMM